MNIMDIGEDTLKLFDQWVEMSSSINYLIIPLAITFLVSIPMYFLRLSKNLIIVAVITIMLTSYAPLITHILFNLDKYLK